MPFKDVTKILHGFEIRLLLLRLKLTSKDELKGLAAMAKKKIAADRMRLQKAQVRANVPNASQEARKELILATQSSLRSLRRLEARSEQLTMEKGIIEPPM